MKKLLSAALAGVMVLSLAACGGSSKPAETQAAAAPAAAGAAAAAPAEKVSWRVASQSNDGVLFATYLKEMAEEVGKRTNGGFELTVYTNAALGADREIAEGVQAGMIECGQVTYAVLANFCPALGVSDLPYLIPDWDKAVKYLESDVMAYQADQLAANGFKSLGALCYGFRSCTNNKRPIKTLADFEGIKFRVMQSDLYIDTFKALGAYPIGMAKSEIITALQQNTIDGQENPMEINYSEGMAEVQKYVSRTGHVAAVAGYVCNPDAFNKLPAEYQQVLVDVFNEYRIKLTQAYRESEEDFIKKLQEAGMEYNDVAPEEIEKMRAVCVEQVWPKYQEQYKEQLDIINKLW